MSAHLYRNIAVLLLPLLWLQPVFATDYTNAINNGQWQAHSSVFECSLEQKVPYFGKVVFETHAGRNSCVYLQSRPHRFRAGEARFLARSPVWMEEPQVFEFDKVALKQGLRPFWKGSDYAEKMLAQLQSGMELELEKDQWFEPKQSAPSRVILTPVGFRSEYRQYLRCLGGLLPANFDQMKRTPLYFPPGEIEELDSKMTSKLDRMLKLVKHDAKIRLFYIDGHSDAMGDRADNLELSKKRAELVQQYLTRRGVPEDWITMRWHGERYPVTSNDSKAGQGKNRRVTVRMERVEEIEVLPLALSE